MNEAKLFLPPGQTRRLFNEPSPIFSHFEKPCVNVGFECKNYSRKTSDFVISAIRNTGTNAIWPG
jgi:hypothetical protein